jgi:hypothetical protein
MKKLLRIAIFGLCLLVAATHAMTPPGAPKKGKPPVELTPDRVARKNKDTPLTFVDTLLNIYLQTHSSASRHRCLELSVEKLDADKAASPSGPRAERRKKIAATAKIVMARTPSSPDLAEYHRALCKRLAEEAGLSESFENLCRHEEDIMPIAVKHIVDGDKVGGQHFLCTQEVYDVFLRTIEPTAAENPITHVLHGLYTRGKKTVEKKTGVRLFDRGLDGNIIPRIIFWLHEHATDRTPNRIFGVCPNGLGLDGVPMEIYRQGIKFTTVYPIYSYVEWQPGQPEIIVVPINMLTTPASAPAPASASGAGSADPSKTMSSFQLLGATITFLSIYNPADGPCPIRYVDRANNTMIVDLAPYLPNAANIKRGIYVKFPLAQFDMPMLQTQFPDLFP